MYLSNIDCVQIHSENLFQKKKQVRETQLLFGLGETLGETSLQVKFV